VEIKKYFIIKKTTIYKDIVRIDYFKGYSKWVSKYEKAKLYQRLTSVKKILEGFHPAENTKFEILFITTTIETLDDVAEKELLT
jgi:hypothetical protein